MSYHRGNIRRSVQKCYFLEQLGRNCSLSAVVDKLVMIRCRGNFTFEWLPVLLVVAFALPCPHVTLC